LFWRSLFQSFFFTSKIFFLTTPAYFPVNLGLIVKIVPGIKELATSMFVFCEWALGIGIELVLGTTWIITVELLFGKL